MNPKELLLLNSYFREFVLSHKDFLSDEPEGDAMYKILKYETIAFDRSWAYLMVVVEIIEKKWGIGGYTKIEMHDNCVRFELGEYNIFQDKRWTKREALYSCCFQALEKLWKDREPPFKYSSNETFDDIDLE